MPPNPFRTTRRVEFCDTDMAGIVHFANFYRYMEQAEHTLFRELGMQIAGKTTEGVVFGWPRVAAECSFSAPARYDDEVTVEIAPIKRSSRSLTLQYTFLLGERAIARGEMTTVYCLIPPGEAMRAASIPADWAARLEGWEMGLMVDG